MKNIEGMGCLMAFACGAAAIIGFEASGLASLIQEHTLGKWAEVKDSINPILYYASIAEVYTGRVMTELTLGVGAGWAGYKLASG